MTYKNKIKGGDKGNQYPILVKVKYGGERSKIEAKNLKGKLLQKILEFFRHFL